MYQALLPFVGGGGGGGRGGADDDSWPIHTCNTESISIPPTLQLSRPDKSQS